MGLSQKDRIIFATTLLCCLLKGDVPKGARSYRKEKDGMLRPNQWQDLTVRVFSKPRRTYGKQRIYLYTNKSIF